MKKPLKYQFQFNGDTASCYALSAMFEQGWEMCGTKVDEGFTWIMLEKWSY